MPEIKPVTWEEEKENNNQLNSIKK
jgi:hypothetical protein